MKTFILKKKSRNASNTTQNLCLNCGMPVKLSSHYRHFCNKVCYNAYYEQVNGVRWENRDLKLDLV